MAKIPAHLISNGGPDNSGQRGSWQVDGDTGASAMYGAVKDGGNQVSRTSASVYSAMAVLDENQDRTEQIQFSKYLKEKKSSLDVEMANPTNEISKNHKIWDHRLDEYRSEIENYISDSGLNPDVVNPMLDYHYKLTVDDYAIKRNKLRATEQMEAFNTQNELLLTMSGISDEQLKSELVKNATSFKSVLGSESDKFISNVDNFIDSQRFNQHVVADGIGTYERINAKNEDGTHVYYKNLTSEQRADAIVKATKERNRIQVEEQDEIDQLWGEMDRAGDLDEPSKLDSYQRLLEDKKKSGLIDGTFYKREMASVERTKKGLTPKYDEYSEALRSEILQGLDPARRSTHYETFKRLDAKKLTPAIREAIKKDINEIIDPEEAAKGIPDNLKVLVPTYTSSRIGKKGRIEPSYIEELVEDAKIADTGVFYDDKLLGKNPTENKLLVESLKAEVKNILKRPGITFVEAEREIKSFLQPLEDKKKTKKFVDDWMNKKVRGIK